MSHPSRSNSLFILQPTWLSSWWFQPIWKILCVYIYIRVLAPRALFCALGSPNLSGYFHFSFHGRAVVFPTAAIQFATGFFTCLLFAIFHLSCPSTSILGGAAVLNWTVRQIYCIRIYRICIVLGLDIDLHIVFATGTGLCHNQIWYFKFFRIYIVPGFDTDLHGYWSLPQPVYFTVFAWVIYIDLSVHPSIASTLGFLWFTDKPVFMYMQILWLLVVCICRHNSVSDSAAEGTQTTGYSAVSVVQDPHGANHRFDNHTTLDFANLARASFQGPFVPEPCASGASFCQDGELEAKLVRGEGDEPGMEMLPLQANEQETCRILPVLWYTLGAGNRQLALDRCRWGDSSSEKPECPTEWADQIQRRWERKGQGEGKRQGQRQGQGHQNCSCFQGKTWQELWRKMAWTSLSARYQRLSTMLPHRRLHQRHGHHRRHPRLLHWPRYNQQARRPRSRSWWLRSGKRMWTRRCRRRSRSL